jgi:5-methyltetrahydropteroyltriglutamate--homocysteine methyltransferase
MSGPLLAQAQDDATIVAIKEQEDAGLDSITDGEIRPESCSNRFATALDGIEGPTAVHIWFGYAAIVHNQRSGYSFLSEFAACSCQQVSVETARAGLDCSVLAKLAGKQIMVGCLDLRDMTIEAPETVVARVERGLRYGRAERVILAPDCGMK